MEYGILMGGQSIGNARVEKEGLYYKISAKCRLSGTVVCKLTVTGSGHTEDLGILVPEGSWFVVHTKVPMKRLGDGELSFRAVPRHTELRGKFVPLSPEEPFSYLQRLGEAFLEIRDGRMGIVLPQGKKDNSLPT